MHDIWVRIGGNLVDRVFGPLHFRFVLQPVVASIFAIISGLRDAKAHKPPYFWALIAYPADRRAMIKDGWKSVGKVFLVALVLDVAYQIVVFRFVYSEEALIVGFILTVAPYLILRGLVNRLASRR